MIIRSLQRVSLLCVFFVLLQHQFFIACAWGRGKVPQKNGGKDMSPLSMKRPSAEGSPKKTSKATSKATAADSLSDAAPNIGFTPTSIRPQNSNEFTWPKVNRRTLRNVKLWILLSIIGVEASTELFVRMPQEIVYGSAPPAITDSRGADAMVLIFPGAGGPDVHTDDLRRKIEESDHSKGVSR